MLLAALIVGTPAAPPPALTALAVQAAFDLCPKFLDGTVQLGSPELRTRGFGVEVEHKTHPRLGELAYVTSKSAEGEIAFGGARAKICQVVVQMPETGELWGKLHAALPRPLNFVSDPSLDLKGPSMTVETFRAPLAGGQATLQLILATGPKPTVIAQILQSGS